LEQKIESAFGKLRLVFFSAAWQPKSRQKETVMVTSGERGMLFELRCMENSKGKCSYFS